MLSSTKFLASLLTAASVACAAPTTTTAPQTARRQENPLAGFYNGSLTSFPAESYEDMGCGLTADVGYAFVSAERWHSTDSAYRCSHGFWIENYGDPSTKRSVGMGGFSGQVTGYDLLIDPTAFDDIANGHENDGTLDVIAYEITEPSLPPPCGPGCN